MNKNWIDKLGDYFGGVEINLSLEELNKIRDYRTKFEAVTYVAEELAELHILRGIAIRSGKTTFALDLEIARLEELAMYEQQ